MSNPNLNLNEVADQAEEVLEDLMYFLVQSNKVTKGDQEFYYSDDKLTIQLAFDDLYVNLNDGSYTDVFHGTKVISLGSLGVLIACDVFKPGKWTEYVKSLANEAESDLKTQINNAFAPVEDGELFSGS